MESASFVCFYNQMKKDVQAYVEGALLDFHQKALDGIKASLDSTREEVRLKASIWVVEKVSKIQVGETSVRKMLKEKVEKEVGSEDWWDDSSKAKVMDATYKQSLLDAGLEE